MHIYKFNFVCTIYTSRSPYTFTNSIYDIYTRRSTFTMYSTYKLYFYTLYVLYIQYIQVDLRAGEDVWDEEIPQCSREKSAKQASKSQRYKDKDKDKDKDNTAELSRQVRDNIGYSAVW